MTGMHLMFPPISIPVNCAARFPLDAFLANHNLIKPQSLASRLGGTGQSAPVVIFVGFPVLYRGAHILGAILAGPDSKIEGLDALRKAVGELPRNRDIVLYCGCCPFVKCPNVRPAYAALHEMDFSRVKVMVMETNLHTNWVGTISGGQRLNSAGRQEGTGADSAAARAFVGANDRALSRDQAGSRSCSK
jgi:hypothetical protein